MLVLGGFLYSVRRGSLKTCDSRRRVTNLAERFLKMCDSRRRVTNLAERFFQLHGPSNLVTLLWMGFVVRHFLSSFFSAMSKTSLTSVVHGGADSFVRNDLQGVIVSGD